MPEALFASVTDPDMQSSTGFTACFRTANAGVSVSWTSIHTGCRHRYGSDRTVATAAATVFRSTRESDGSAPGATPVPILIAQGPKLRSTQ